MRIRVAEEKDWGDIKAMLEEIHRFESQFDPTYLVDEETAEVLEKWIKKGTKKDGVVFVAEKDGEILGFACGWITKRPEHLYKERLMGDFCYLFVKEEYRGKGIGRKLAETMLDFFRKKGVRFVVLETHLKNERARELYRELGFEEISVNLVHDFHGKIKKSL